MKKHILKVILVGLVVFFSLPLIFEGDASLITEQEASAVQEESADSLPVVSETLPFRTENVLSKYASRFKKFYINSSKTKQQVRQDIASSEGDKFASVNTARNSVNNSYSASDYNNQDLGSVFTDVNIVEDNVSKPNQNSSISSSLPLGAASTKQKMHDNVPVKGLYESSAVDSYESRAQAKEVYNNVMDKVDKATAQPVVQEQKGGIVTVGTKRVVEPSSFTMEGEKTASARVTKESKYVGIASKSSSSGRGSTGKTYGGFGGGGVSAANAGSSFESAGLSSDFEYAAQDAQEKTNRVASTPSERYVTVDGKRVPQPSAPSAGSTNSSSPSAGNNQQPSQPGQQTQPGQQPGQPDPNAGNNQQPDEGNQQGGNTPKPALFDPSALRGEYDQHASCFMPQSNPLGISKDGAEPPAVMHFNQIAGTAETNPTEKNTADSDVKKEETAPKPQETLIDPNCPSERPIHPIKNIDKFKVLVELGVDPKYPGSRIITASADVSTTAKILDFAGAKTVVGGTPYKGMPAFAVISDKEFNQIARKNDTVIFAASPDVKQRYNSKTVQINPAELETYEGLDRVSASAAEVLTSLDSPQKVADNKKATAKQDAQNKKEDVKTEVNKATAQAAARS